MCDNLTSSATEDSCHLCDSWQQCRGAGCIWDQRHTSCIEGRDHFSVLYAGLICMFGWCFVIWCVGWLIKDTGQVSQLRRYGVQVTGEVVGRWTEQEVVRTLEGYSVVVNSCVSVSACAAAFGGMFLVNQSGTGIMPWWSSRGRRQWQGGHGVCSGAVATPPKTHYCARLRWLVWVHLPRTLQGTQ
jgi:hypothetical protein